MIANAFLFILLLFAVATMGRGAVRKVSFKDISHKDVRRGEQDEVPHIWPCFDLEVELEIS